MSIFVALLKGGFIVCSVLFTLMTIAFLVRRVEYHLYGDGYKGNKFVALLVTCSMLLMILLILFVIGRMV